MVGEAQFDDVMEVEALTDDHIRTWLKAMTEKGPDAVNPEEMEAIILSSVRLKSHIANPTLRSMQPFLGYRTFLRAHNLGDTHH